MLTRREVGAALLTLINNPRWWADETTMEWRADGIECLRRVIADENEKSRLAEIRALLNVPENELEGEIQHSV